MERTCAAIAVAMLFVICAIMLWDVVARYFLAQPLPWSNEVIKFLMAAIFFAALPVATFRNEHIVVDIISQHFRGGWERARAIACHIAVAGFMGLLAYYCVDFALRLMRYGDQTDWLDLPLHIVAWAAAAALAISALICATRAVILVLGSRR